MFKASIELPSRAFFSSTAYGAVEPGEGDDEPGPRLGQQKGAVALVVSTTLALLSILAVISNTPLRQPVEGTVAPQLRFLDAEYFPTARCLDGTQVQLLKCVQG